MGRAGRIGTVGLRQREERCSASKRHSRRADILGERIGLRQFQARHTAAQGCSDVRGRHYEHTGGSLQRVQQSEGALPHIEQVRRYWQRYMEVPHRLAIRRAPLQRRYTLRACRTTAVIPPQRMEQIQAYQACRQVGSQ